MRGLNKKTISLLLGALVAMLGAAGAQQIPTAKIAPSAHPNTTATASTSASSKSPLPSPETFYKVVKVVDGDTIDVEIEGKKVKVRLIGLDTPEIVDPRKPVQCFAKEASAHAKELLTGKSVRLETDPSQDLYDKYKRLLAYVFLEDGTNFNEQMIRDGYGHEYTYDRPYKYQKEFKKAEAEARVAGRGLWASSKCSLK